MDGAVNHGYCRFLVEIASSADTWMAMETQITLSFAQLFESSFVDQVFSNIDISIKSKKDYLYRIERFQQFISKAGTFDRNSLLEFKRHLSLDSSIAVTTKNKYLIVAKIFCQQLYRLGVLKMDITTGVKSFRLNSGFKVNGFTDAEIEAIVAKLSQLDDIRLKTILTLKLFSGLRDIEITRLTVEGINIKESMILVHGKGRDSAEALPIVPQVSKMLSNYLTVTGKKSGYLFESRKRKGSGLTTKTVWSLVRQFLNDLGIDRNPHQCRAFFCTELVKRMDNLFDVIMYTRHRSIQTLQFYANQIGKEKTIAKYRTTFVDLLLE